MNIEEANRHIAETLKMEKNRGGVLNTLDKSKPVFIYGSGNFGHSFYRMISEYNTKAKDKINVNCFLDRYIDLESKCVSSQEIPTLRPDDVRFTRNLKEQSIVVIAILLVYEKKEDIIEYLSDLGYKNIIYDVALISDNSTFMLDYSTKHELNSSKCFDEEKIFSAINLLEDNVSRSVFAVNLRAHWLNDYRNTLVNTEYITYFKTNCPMSKGYSRVIDCGANIGDSLEALLLLHKCESYVGFEPDSHMFLKLCEMTRKVQDTLGEAFLYPCAVGEENGLLRFDGNRAGASRLSQNGEQIVQVVRIDDVLKNMHPTFIKMDIEGAEIAALKGAKETIQKYQPDLAICAYHKITDLWEIPLLLHDFVPQYKFYMLSHFAATLETVLYATI